MFYSRDLLARKTSLGLIWMAVTMKEKMNRSKLNNVDIKKICQQILNPSVPIALRLSATLMTGVVIIYGQKVDLLLGDAKRLLVEFNAVWKVPKGKTQPKYKSVTLPPNLNEDLVEDEELLPYSNTTRQGGFYMKLDNVDVPDLNQNQEQDHHQAEAATITLDDSFQPVADTATFNHLGRFDVEGDDEEIELEFIPSQLPKSDEVLERQSKKANLDQRRIGRRRARSLKSLASMFNQTTSISEEEHLSWVKNVPIDIVRERKPVRWKDAFLLMKENNVMELPCIVQMEKLVTGGGEVYYPKELMELYGDSIPTIFTEPARDVNQPLHRGVGSTSTRISSIEKQRASTAVPSNEMPLGILTGELRSNRFGVSASKVTSIAIPAYSGDEVPTPWLEPNLGRSGKKRPFSATKKSGNAPEPPPPPPPAAADPSIMLSKNKLTQDYEPQDQITDSIRMLKANLDAPKIKSLNQLASGMKKNMAASLFYQTCVLATKDKIRVEQEVPYGDIIFSKW